MKLADDTAAIREARLATKIAAFRSKKRKKHRPKWVVDSMPIPEGLIPRCTAPAKGGRGIILCGKPLKVDKFTYPRKEYCGYACKVRANYYRKLRKGRKP